MQLQDQEGKGMGICEEAHNSKGNNINRKKGKIGSGEAADFSSI